MNSKGFTLIELLVVMAIIVMITALAMPSISSYFQMSLNSATRELATNVNEAFNSAVLTGNVYRVVYDLKENSFWVESGPNNVLLDTEESKEKEERKRKVMSSSSEKPIETRFSMDKDITRKKVSLPRGVVYEDIITQQSKNPINEGKAYTHFFPHGVTEQTIIHLQDNSKHQTSLVISPLLGMTDVYDHYVKPNEVFPQ